MFKKVSDFLLNTTYVPLIILCLIVALLEEFIGWQVAIVVIVLFLGIFYAFKLKHKRNVSELVTLYINGDENKRDEIVSTIDDEELMAEVALKIEKLGGKFYHWSEE